MTMVRGEDFSKEVAFARKHKSRVLQIFLDSGNIRTASAWGISEGRYKQLAQEVLDMDAGAMKQFVEVYRRTDIQAQKGEMEQKRMLILRVQNLASRCR